MSQCMGNNIENLLDYITIKKTNNKTRISNLGNFTSNEKKEKKEKENIYYIDDTSYSHSFDNIQSINKKKIIPCTTTTNISTPNTTTNTNKNNNYNNTKDHNVNSDPDMLMQKGFSLLLEGAKRKKIDLQKFSDYQDYQNTKYNAFDSLCTNNDTKNPIIGNIIYNTAKEKELDIITKSIDLAKRCAIIFNEEKCRMFVDEHKKIILCTAINMFKKKMSTKMRGYKIYVKKIDDESNNINNQDQLNSRSNLGININKKCNKNNSEIFLKSDKDDDDKSETCLTFKVKGIKYSDLITNFDKQNIDKTQSKEIQKKMMKDNTLPPKERQRLDITVAKHSQVFSLLHRMDHKKTLYRKHQTFWQCPHNFPIEIVGWYEQKPIPGLLVNLNKEDIFFLPHSFQNMAHLLVKNFKGYVTKKKISRLKLPLIKNRNIIPSDTRFLIPQNDMPGEYETLLNYIDDCLMTLLSVNTEVLSESSIQVYKQKFRRYCIYSFCIYLLNSSRHAESISPLPYNYFNFYAYMFAHDTHLKSATFLNTMCFLNNNLFKLYKGPVSDKVQQLVNADYNLFKGGKSTTHTFGSPVKTSIHTRTLVSYMMYSEYMMKVLCQLLEMINTFNQQGKYDNIRNKTRQSLSRLCDSMLFVYFTFIFFHRVSAVRHLTNWAALRLILGQPHIHDYKSKAKSIVNTRSIKHERNEEMGNDSNQFLYTSTPKNAQGLFFSHAHILGLPYGLQKRLGVPVEKINPLISSSQLYLGIGSKISNENIYNIAAYINNNNNNIGKNNIFMCGIDLPLPPPPPDGYCSKITMFDNIFSEQINDYYNNDNLISNLAITVAKTMKLYSWTGMSLINKDVIFSNSNKILYTNPPCAFNEDEYKLSKDTFNYLSASPLKNVFILTTSTDNKKRIISMGDLALIALWIKVSILSENWENQIDSSSLSSSFFSSNILTNDKAVSVSENWLNSLCGQMIRIDLVNFGVWGDTKINLKLDKRNNTLHRNNINPPKEIDKRRYANTSLSQRKNLSQLHYKTNIKTKTHLGRVTATSWVICAIKAIAAGDPDIFLKLLEDVGIYHLSHTNPANTYVYFSDNCLSNEDQMGLNGYIERMQNTNGQLVLHNSAKKELSMGAFSPTNKQRSKLLREKATTSIIKMAIKYWATVSKDDKYSNDNNNTEPIVDTSKFSTRSILWKWPYDPQQCLRGQSIPLVCKQTKFLHFCMSDSLVAYKYNDPASKFHLKFKVSYNNDFNNNDHNDTKIDNYNKLSTPDFIDQVNIDDIMENINKDETKIKDKDNILSVNVDYVRDKLSLAAVVTTGKNILNFDKLKLTKTENDRKDIEKHLLFTKIAADIRDDYEKNKKNNNSYTKNNKVNNIINKNISQVGENNTLSNIKSKLIDKNYIDLK
uniref:Wsv433-like protein n=1 Tax=Trachysalambria curvirostris majanivirus TaxID=2984281 RepID=A0A9C7C6S7_9VIRU|nr:MAG: wsv433-like protein [Trachysalambria curvirostris majanivirus]